ncbi:Uncharacterized protein Rs2_20411 [Raphanus sativus]|nr:Uncharacterized protein Rs2_20411 [Raphanus sativus]
MASVQYGLDQGMETFNDELMIMSFLEEELPSENHNSVNEEEEEKLNRVIRSLEVEINMSSPTIESQKTDLQEIAKPGLEDDFGWLNDFDIGLVSSQNDDEMTNWCMELSYMDGMDSSVLEIEECSMNIDINQWADGSWGLDKPLNKYWRIGLTVFKH